jgi:glycosyltransferase involved in cell wall biosynthesis
MRVLFLFLNLPDLEKDNNLYGDLALEFADRGHEVFVATLLEARNRKRTFETRQKGIRILFVRSADLFNVGFVKKGISLLALQRNFKRAIGKHWKGLEFDLVIYPTPPISFLGVIRWLRKRSRCRTYLILRDIFPQNAVDVGIISKGPVYGYFRAMEKGLYAASDRIGCMSPKNVEYVLGHNALPRDKVGLLPNWRRIRDLSAFEGRDFRNEMGLGRRTVAVFGGVIGIAQEIEFLLDLARLYRDSETVCFLIIGDGNRYGRVAEIVRRDGLSNVVLRRKVSSDEFAALLKHCDIGLVNLNRHFTIPNYPSKVLDYFEASLPVLAATDPSTDFGQLLDDSGAGLHCLTGDLGSYACNFETLVSDLLLRIRMGSNGRKYLESHLTVDRAYRTIMDSSR